MDSAPDYELAATLRVAGPAAHAALGDPRRRRIVALLSERAATAKQLAQALDRSPQATTHHLDVLHDAGLVRVVRTQRVRATTQRWWGRTARVFVFEDADEATAAGLGGRGGGVLREAVTEIGAALDAGVPGGPHASLRYARIPAARAEEWYRRLAGLVDELSTEPRDGDTVHGVLVSVFPTAWPTMEDPTPPARGTDDDVTRG